MAKSNQAAPARTASIEVSPPESSGVIAAWDGLYHAFGARVEGFDVTPDGIVIRGLSFSAGFNPEQIVKDVNHQNRRVQLFPTILWLNGEEPAPITTPQAMTAFMVQHFRGASGEGSTRSPEYVRKAFAALKGELGISNKRGPKPRTISLKNLGAINASTFTAANVNRSDLQALMAVAQEALDATPEETAEVEVTA